KDDVGRRLLQSLEERVKRCIGNLVGFVEDINLVTVTCRTIAGGVTEFADLVDAAVRGGVNLNHVYRAAGSNLSARFAHAARFRSGLVGGAAIEGHGQNARDRGLADPAVAAEDVAMRDPQLLDGVLQRAGHMVLANDLRKALRAVFAR